MVGLAGPGTAQYRRPDTRDRATPPERLAAALVSNGDLEAGTLAGWTARDQDGGSGAWSIQSGVSSPVSGFVVPAPPQGVLAAMTDQIGPGSHILYQDITLPAGQPSTLSFLLYIGNRADSFVIPDPPTLDFTVVPNQHFRVDIMDPSAPVDSVTTGVLKNVYITKPGDPLESGYITVSASLDAFAGQQIRLRFAEVDNQLFFQVGIDSVTIGPGGTPGTGHLVNLSTRGLVRAGDEVLIGGFVINGTGPKTVLLRALGPTLGTVGVPGALANPALTLFSGANAIARNDDWQDQSDPLCEGSGYVCGSPSDIAATQLAPPDPLEAALLITLAPGPYTAIVTGVAGNTGLGLIEVYDVARP